jgi:hypothetical protein
MSVQALSCAFAIRGLSSSEKLVLLALANFANEKMQCWPSQERIAADTELSDRTVWTALKGLETKGLLSRQSRKRADGTRSTDVFTLHFSLTVTSEPIANSANSSRKSCEGQSQILQEPVAAVATLTTFEPSIEPISEANASAGLASRTPDERAWDEALGVLVGQGGMSSDKARSFFGGLLKAHGLKPADMLAPLAEAYRLGTKDPQGYLKAAAMARQRRQTGPPKRVGFV